MKTKPAFGDKVFVESRLRRIHGSGGAKSWESLKTDRNECIFIGWRTLFNGETDSDEYGIYFQQGEKVKAALVVNNSRENPFYVFIEDLISPSTKGHISYHIPSAL